MSKQCLSIEQMKHLKELGVDISKASAYWHNVVKFEKKKHVIEWIISLTDSVPLSTKTIPAFTLQDILDVLPKDISREGCTWSASYEHKGSILIGTDTYFGEDFYKMCQISNTWNYGGEKIIAWMPIPSFEEILQANKDVLKRLKDR